MLIVRESVGPHVRVPSWSAVGGVPVCPGAYRLRPRRGWPPSYRVACSFWSGGCWERAELLPAGEERVGPWQVGADLQGGVAGEAGEAGEAE